MKSMNTPFPDKQYHIKVKRNPNDSVWSDWTITDDYYEALRQLEKIKEIGFCGKIVDKSGISDAVKMIEEEYKKAKKLDYVKNPLAFALYAVWKKIDKKGVNR